MSRAMRSCRWHLHRASLRIVLGASARPWATEVNSLPVVMRSPKRSREDAPDGGYEAGAAGEEDLVDVLGREARLIKESVDGPGDLRDLGGDPMLEVGAGDAAAQLERAGLGTGEEEAGVLRLWKARSWCAARPGGAGSRGPRSMSACRASIFSGSSARLMPAETSSSTLRVRRNERWCQRSRLA